MDIKKQIIDNKEYAIKLLSDLISFESVLDEFNPNSEAPFGLENKKCLEYLLNAAKKDGFIVKNVDNYAGHIEYGTGEEALGILAHLDVVPVKKDEWDSYPFKLDIRDGKMYARGAIDDKGPLVASYIALKMLKDNGFKPNKRIRLIVGCDEESGSRCLGHYFKHEEKPSIGFSPDAEFPVIYGEKGMMSYDIIGELNDDFILEFSCGERYNIVPSIAKMKLAKDLSKEYKEYLALNNYNGEIIDDYYIAYGKAAHAMCPQNGVNAAYILFDFLNKYTSSRIAKFMDEYFLFDVNGKKLGYYIYDDDMKHLTSNFAIVDIKNNKLRMGINCRIPVDSQAQVIKDCVSNATGKYNLSYEVINESKRHFVDPNSNLVKSLMKCYQEVTGDYETKPFTIGGGTYARELNTAVAFGPVFVGREDVCHIANEYMYEDDFYNSIEVYYKSIYELTK
ncbi:MAG: dipeptidase PepV [Acholeplasmatales bacterium]|nr:dipeptidase PepV [Acholeplasmatales bacterium]